MARHCVRRLWHGLLVLAGLSVFIFVLARLMPGDPVRLMLPDEATAADVQRVRRQLGLDRPLPVQYVLYVKGLIQGRFGPSFQSRRDVADDLAERLPATLELVLVGMGLAIVAGVPLGVVSALYKDRWPDHCTRLCSFASIALPRFWSGIMLQLAFAYALRWLPLFGRIDTPPPEHLSGLYLLDSLLTANWPALASSLRHIALPAVALGVSPMAQIMRITRGSMLDEQGKEYTVISRVLGMPHNLLVYKYMLRNACTSTLTIIGLLFGWSLGGAFVVETVFAWPGMARYGVQAVLFKDFNAVIGVTLITGVTYILINLLVDVLYGYVDPRLRVSR